MLCGYYDGINNVTIGPMYAWLHQMRLLSVY